MVHGAASYISTGITKQKKKLLIYGGYSTLFFFFQYSEFVKFHFGYDDMKAASIASTAQVAPIFLMPFLGLFVDKYGKRTWISKLFLILKKRVYYIFVAKNTIYNSDG